MTAPNPWPVPDAAVEAFFRSAALFRDDESLTDETRRGILAALPHLGIAELLRESAESASWLSRYIGDDCWIGEGGDVRRAEQKKQEDLANRLRDAAARMKGTM